MPRRLVLAFAFAACGKPAPAPATAPAPSHDHDHDHEHAPAHSHGAPHGGIVQSAGKYHLEAVASKVGLMVFLLDEQEKELPVDGVTGTVLLSTKDGKPPTEAPFEAMGNHVHAMVSFSGPWTAVVTLKVGADTLSARFEGEGVGAKPHEHAMPQMKLSETVTAQVVPAGSDLTKPIPLTLSFRKNGAEKDLADFEVVHEQKLHTFVVSDDLSFFAHVHPEATDAQLGLWKLEQTFPGPGTYYVYNDFKSTAEGATVTRNTLSFEGLGPAPKPLVVDTAMTKTFDGLTVTLSASLSVGETMLRYTIADANGPVKDLEPYLGAFGHLFILKDDKTTMAHAHPSGPEPTPEARSGPEVAFHTVLPAAGVYKLWAQFKRAGKVVTTDWTVEVK